MSAEAARALFHELLADAAARRCYDRVVAAGHRSRRSGRQPVRLPVIAGGECAVFESHRSVLSALGNRIFYVGPLGAAAALKLITNLLAFIHLVMRAHRRHGDLRF